eukprot:5195290-Amphidinium_carterae.1
MVALTDGTLLLIDWSHFECSGFGVSGASQSVSTSMKQQSGGTSQSSSEPMRHQKKSDDETGSRADSQGVLALCKVRTPDPSEDDCAPTQLEAYTPRGDFTPTKVDKKRFSIEQTTVTSKAEPRKELLASALSEENSTQISGEMEAHPSHG